jgi:hypothetical protein
VGIGNYAILDLEKSKSLKQEDKTFTGYWRMSFDGVCSSSGNGVGIVLKIPDKVIYPHAIILEFPYTNNETKYESLIQGMILAFEITLNT